MSELREKYQNWLDDNFLVELPPANPDAIPVNWIYSAYQAGYAQALKELSEVEPVAWVQLGTSTGKRYVRDWFESWPNPVPVNQPNDNYGTALIPRPKGTDHE